MSSAVGDALFTKTQQKVLGLLFGAPDKSFYLNEIVRLAGSGKGTINRELARMEAAGLVVAVKKGNQKHYQANSASPVFDELIGLVRKSFGVADVLRDCLSELLPQIELAFVYGSVAKGNDVAESDIDLLVVTEDLAYGTVMELMEEAELKLGRPVNPSLYSMSQLEHKLAAGSAFVRRVLEQPKLWIKGSEGDIGKVG